MRLFSIQSSSQENIPDPPKYDWPKKPEKTAILLTQSQDFLDGRQDIFDLLATSEESSFMIK